MAKVDMLGRGDLCRLNELFDLHDLIRTVCNGAGPI